MSNRPAIGMFHALARSGATIISRHLGAMAGVALYSEIHPQGPAHALKLMSEPKHFAFNIRVQAGVWFKLYQDTEAPDVFRQAGQDNDRNALIEVIERTRAGNLYPILRDWAHIDFIGPPFAAPSNRPTLLDIIQNDYTVHRAALVRHPMANFLSITMTKMLVGYFDSADGFLCFMRGYHHYLDAMPADRLIRYEDFLKDKTATIKHLADLTGAPFDPDFAAKAENYLNLTGDRAATSKDPVRKQVRQIDPGFWDAAQNNSLYRGLLDRLGYDPAEMPPGYELGQ